MPVPRSYTILAGAGLMSVVGIWVVSEKPPNPELAPATVTVPPGSFEYREAGNFRYKKRLVDPPMQHRHAGQSLRIMKTHVTQSDYNRCVADGMCTASHNNAAPDLAQVNVSFVDATTYATWLSGKTGQTWRLPTDEEWVRAAGDRQRYVLLNSDNVDPSKNWIAKYQAQAALRGASDPELRPVGHFGENNFGISDINGNIWEWTTTCFKSAVISPDSGELTNVSDFCGIRAVQGQHTAFIVDFVRDAKGGGCAVGLPPDNLGIRLVFDPDP